MTVKEAKETFARLMAKSREGQTLTAADRSRLRTASQIIRYAHRKTAANDPKRKGRTWKVGARAARNRAMVKNAPAVLIYESITRIEGTKGRKSQYPNEKFFHNFKRPYPRMYGLQDGSLLIVSK